MIAKNLRYLVAVISFALVTGLLLPKYGVTPASGMLGVLVCTLSGVLFTLVFRLVRRLEPWLLRRYAATTHAADNVTIFGGLLISVSIGSSIILLTAHFLPTALSLTHWGYAFVGGFWLWLFGCALTPSPTVAWAQKFSPSSPPAVPIEQMAAPVKPTDELPDPAWMQRSVRGQDDYSLLSVAALPDRPEDRSNAQSDPTQPGDGLQADDSQFPR